MELVVHCKRAAYDEYVGRAAGSRGRWGNPFRIGPDGTREEVIDKHRRWLWRQLCAGEVSLEELAALADKVLGCWCAPRVCHAETLVRAARWAQWVLAGEAEFDRGSDEPSF